MPSLLTRLVTPRPPRGQQGEAAAARKQVGRLSALTYGAAIPQPQRRALWRKLWVTAPWQICQYDEPPLPHDLDLVQWLGTVSAQEKATRARKRDQRLRAWRTRLLDPVNHYRELYKWLKLTTEGGRPLVLAHPEGGFTADGLKWMPSYSVPGRMSLSVAPSIRNLSQPIC